MIQDFSNGFLFEDEGDHAEGAATLTFQRVGEIDPFDELRPTFSDGGPFFWGELGFALACGAIVGAERLKSFHKSRWWLRTFFFLRFRHLAAR
jgi:hypothetical protein